MKNRITSSRGPPCFLFRKMQRALLSLIKGDDYLKTKKYKEKQLWRRGTTLFLAMLMLMTCVGSAFPAFADTADSGTTVVSGEAQQVEPGDSVASASGSDMALPDETEQDLAPPDAAPDGDIVLPDGSDSDSKLLPDEENSTPPVTDEDENDPTQQPDDSSAAPENPNPPEDVESGGQHPDAEKPSEDESDKDTEEGKIPAPDGEKPSDTAETPFQALAILDPENGASVTAAVGDTVTFKASVNRDDVEVRYQWQKFQKPAEMGTHADAIYDYAEGAPTHYAFPMEGESEAEALANNPDMKWPGIEMYRAVVNALNEIGADSSSVSLAWRTPNFALNGYAISAAQTADGIEVYADKDGERHAAHLNADGKWAFGEAEERSSAFGSWVDIEGANSPEYTFTVTEDDYDTTFHCVVTVLDEVYLSQCVKMLEENGAELTDAQKNAQQSLYSLEMRVVRGEDQEPAPKMTFSAAKAMMRAAASNITPHLSSDAQWIEGLDSTYEYVTKDTYNRVQAWLKNGEITQEQADRYWTQFLPKGFDGTALANVLDDNGKPTGATRPYSGFDLTGGKLEVNSEWYGKTVYFRVHGSGGTGTAINIPAYTNLTVDANGHYVEGASGTKYKNAVTFLNPYVKDTGSMYEAYLQRTTTNGWLWNMDESGNGTGTIKNQHITIYTVDAEKFNADPQQYMVDAEGNYRVDSVGWGVCTGLEPDLSGKAYWVLKDFLTNGYGFLSGHDTLYAYPGAYYDNFGIDLDESTIDSNDGATWYYDRNSWLPGTSGTSSTGATSTQRGGHFYLNELMGSNKGNVDSGTTVPSDAVSLILSIGGSHSKYEKNVLFGGRELRVREYGFSAAQAESNPKYRIPTNFPYKIPQTFKAALTHTNHQAAFGPIWVDYTGNNEELVSQYGFYNHSDTWSIGNKTGTNNFYLSGTGNYLMNQIGHLPTNSASAFESALFTNSVFYVSQRKQCEVCAANQAGQETVHFVRRINSSNASAVLKALQAGGSYWYPIDGCYQLTEDLTLPENWTPIKGFKGHWNSDVYTVKLASNGAPLLDNTKAGGTSGWNLGTNMGKGTQNVFDSSMARTTGVARVLGDLNDLFNTKINYANYTVKILGSDNPRYMSAGEVYSCTVNTDSKYVISNLPCVYDTGSHSGVMQARVYRPDGSEVTEYGKIRVNVDKAFWNNDMTTPLYLGNFTVQPVSDEETYESAQAIFIAFTSASEKPSLVGWQYRENASSAWKAVPTSWDISIKNEERITADGNYTLDTQLTLNKADPAFNGYEFRALFSSPSFGEWNTYEYWMNGAAASNTNNGGAVKSVALPEKYGRLTVLLWPGYTEQSPDKTVCAGGKATFTSVGYAMDDGSSIKAEWQYSTEAFDRYKGTYLEWRNVKGDPEWGGLEVISTQSPVLEYKSEIDAALREVNPMASIPVFHNKAQFHSLKTSLTVNKVDLAQSGTHFRVRYTATSSHGTKVEWYSDIADEKSGAWTTDSGMFGSGSITKKEKNSNILTVEPPALQVVTTPSANCGGALNPDTLTPDEYGQMVLLSDPKATAASGAAVYEAILYYKPDDAVPTATWQYMTYMDHTPRFWADSTRSQWMGSKPQQMGLTVNVSNSDLGMVYTGAYAGYHAMKSVLRISNIPGTMYNPETLTKYYFRCIGTQSYTTLKENYSNSRVDKWGGLVIDYAIDMQHNGVLNYGKHNYINGSYVSDAEGIVQATANQTYSDWTYPDLEIHVPAGHTINTSIIYLDPTVAHDSRDTIIYNYDVIYGSGIKITEDTGDKLVLVSGTKDSVPIDVWRTVLRTFVAFRTYDQADFTSAKVATNTTGGARVKWLVDEARLDGLTIDTNGGKAYKVVDAGKVVSWAEAYTMAQGYDPAIGLNGRLATINNKAQNDLVKRAMGSDQRSAWLSGVVLDGLLKWETPNYTTNTNDLTVAHYSPGFTRNDDSCVYLTYKANGSWELLPESGESMQSLVLYNLGCGACNDNNVIGGLVVGDTYMDKTTKLTSFSGVYGHKYYVLGSVGDYGDANSGGRLYSDQLGFSENNNWCNEHNRWQTGVQNIFTYTGATGSPVEIYMKTSNLGDDITGLHLYCHYLNVFDLTATFGAGNEPSVEQVNQWLYAQIGHSDPVGDTVQGGIGGDISTHGVYFAGDMPVTSYEKVSTDIQRYVVEFDVESLRFAMTDHSATDETFIGTKAKYTPNSSNKSVTAVITGNTKVYDGTQISPAAFTVYGAEAANESLFNITYTAVVPNNQSGYGTKTVNGSDWRNTGAVNATRYHVKVALTDAAKRAGWQLTDDSVLECDLIINQRPVNVYSYHNNRVYDQTSVGVINNITAAGRSGDTGVIPGDTVRFNTTTVYGTYVDGSGKAAFHNSVTNNGGSEYIMYRNAKLSDLYILHTDGSDPHCNYTLGTETYTGAIQQRPVVVHSRYLDDPENPRNVKSYDATRTATISNIILDNVLKGDKIGLKEQTMTGTYATEQAGETLNADGTVQKDRIKKLTENVITASSKAELTGNDFSDYYIAQESYSGAISRALLEVRISSAVKLYGEADIQNPWSQTAFDKNSKSVVDPTKDGWLSITGLQGGDTITLNNDSFKLAAYDKNGAPINFQISTPVGRYPITEQGINETNLPVLRNYILDVYTGTLEIHPREIMVTVSDSDWCTQDDGVPEFHTTFELLNDDRETYKMVGSDGTDNYTVMKLIGSDTVAKVIRLTDGKAIPTIDSSTGVLQKQAGTERKEFTDSDGNKVTVMCNGTNIDYSTPWYVFAPARYLDLEKDFTLYACEWCEKYYGFTLGTDHWHVAGYELKINQNAEQGKVMSIATVTNPLGETVQNYTLKFVPGTLRVHPKLRFQLKATVPMYVCMYAYNGDGEMVEPTEYGITNFSNGPIEITDIDVDSNQDGEFLITDKPALDLLRGEMSMNVYGTQLVPGSNKPANPERWIIAEDRTGGEKGVKLALPLECYIAGGNVNDETVCTPVTKVTYTITEYGKTVPDQDGYEIPDHIHGEPTTLSPTG